MSIPLHCTAIGKAILSGLSRAELREVPARIRPTAVTPRTIINPDLLIARLAAVTERGYAVDDEETEAHICIFADRTCNFPSCLDTSETSILAKRVLCGASHAPVSLVRRER
ncbi:IclR family transcriptional regulator C-terminal domain-containing protein [Nocardia sp. NPDC049526]|uniref:IclR family transcriptional regulator domain-containing protein n=1 Tax=Nocardia sp. NPDC049526 TaxID=3364316 RepID=UPI00379F2F32